MTPQQLKLIAAAVTRLGADDAQGPLLRDEFPGIHFSFCADDDVLHTEPVWQGFGFNLYLIDSSDHCLSLTSELSSATGVLVAATE